MWVVFLSILKLTLLAMITHSAVRSSTQILFTMLFFHTHLNNVWYNKGRFLIGKPCWEIITGDAQLVTFRETSNVCIRQSPRWQAGWESGNRQPLKSYFNRQVNKQCRSWTFNEHPQSNRREMNWSPYWNPITEYCKKIKVAECLLLHLIRVFWNDNNDHVDISDILSDRLSVLHTLVYSM